MFEILGRPDGRLADASPRPLHEGQDKIVRLRLRENRSHLPEHAREAVTALIALFMAAAIVPAAQGRILVPLFALATMAALVLALEWHQRRPPPEERLEIGDGQWRHVGKTGRTVDLPSHWLRFELERRGGDVRLVFHHRMQRFEVGHCLTCDERRAIAPILARALDASNSK